MLKLGRCWPWKTVSSHLKNKEGGCVLSVSGQCVVARSALLASSPCDLYSVSGRPLSGFGLWIILFILLPPSLLPFYFSCDKSLWQVPGPICVGAHGWKARVYQGLACCRHSVSRVRCSENGERVKSYTDETRGKKWGESGASSLPFPFSLSFFFLVNFSTAFYHLNTWNPSPLNEAVVKESWNIC